MATTTAIPCAFSSALLVALFTGPAMAQASKTVAKVNGEPITQAEVDAILKIRPLKFVKLSDQDRREMQQEALDMLIDDLIMDQFLRKHVRRVPASAINQKLRELQDSLTAQGQTLEEYCHETGESEAEVRAAIVNFLRRRVYLATHLNDAAVRKYYEENRLLFDQVAVRASHILVRLAPDSSAADRAAAQARLQAIRAQIVAGKLDFAQAAKTYSQCPSAPYGGDIGFFPPKGVVDEDFARVAFALKKDEISDMVQSKDGLHLIKVTDRKAGVPSDFMKIEDKVRELAGAEMMVQILAQQRAEARIELSLGGDHGAKGNTGDQKKGSGLILRQ